MGLIEKIIMWRYRTEAITQRDVKALLRQMRLFKQAHIEGNAIPALPHSISRQFRTVWIWAAFRLSVEQPGHFVLGLLLSVPAIGLLLFQFIDFLIRFIESSLPSFAGN